MAYNKTIIIGAGGHARVLLDALQERGLPVYGLTDIDPLLRGQPVLNVPVIGDDSVISLYPLLTTLLVNGIGSIDSTAIRRAVFERFKRPGFSFLTVAHPSAVISSHATFGEGVQVMAGAVVQPGVRLGDNTIVNTRASVDHDCVIGAHCHIAPGATLSGAVQVGDGTHIGTGAVIKQGVKIGAGCLVAAGAVVIHNLEDGERVCGVPSRALA